MRLASLPSMPLAALTLVACLTGCTSDHHSAPLTADLSRFPHHVEWPVAKPVWSFSWTPPDQSSGINGSGIELRDVTYKGHLVLGRAHVPCLNVLYDTQTAGLCGAFGHHSYRDWLNEFAPMEVDNVMAPGYAQPSKAVLTVCEHPDSDVGDFKGVAAREESGNLVLTSQFQAGWYRYIQKWVFHPDGTLDANFAFTAVTDPCTTHPHDHHVYWRLDFDIDGPQGDVIEEFNPSTPAAPGPATWQTILKEDKRFRDDVRGRKWRVRDTVTGRGYEIVPIPDGNIMNEWADADVWALRHHDEEIDDGGATTGRLQNAAHISTLLNGEDINGQDVVFWLHGSNRHAGTHECHTIGATLKPTGTWD